MANEDARQFIANQITGLRIAVQELTRLHLITGDLDLAGFVRSDQNIQETLSFLTQVADLIGSA